MNASRMNKNNKNKNKTDENKINKTNANKANKANANKANTSEMNANKIYKNAISIVTVMMLLTVILGGCGQVGDSSDHGGSQNAADTERTDSSFDTGMESKNSTEFMDPINSDANAGAEANAGSELAVRFGDEGEIYRMYLEENETAAAIARYVGTSEWRLPIYEEDEDADYDVLQYYDIASSYEIPSQPENVTSVKAGDVYYSDPNRIVLFYQDAEISEEYTRIGTFDATDEFVTAVENNPVLEGWGNKIIHIAQP